MPKQTYLDEAGMYNVRLGWTPSSSGYEGHVQVGIETADGRPVAAHLTIVGDLVVDGGERLVSPASASDLAEFQSLWGTLSRSSINALIRDLRRARDSVYGADA
jgi:hypothetical protein